MTLRTQVRRFVNLLRQTQRTLRDTFRNRPYPNDYSYQMAHMHYLPQQGIILDVASGHNPFPRATILSERFLDKTLDRKEPLTRDHRPMVVMDIHHLPYKSKSIDYLYCSHVLEHVEDPARACAEIMRVSKAGYIETPTLMKDALFAWAEDIHHKWHVVKFENRLVFFEYEPRPKAGIRSAQWRKQIMRERYHPNQDIYYQNLDLFNTILEWHDQFEVTVFRLEQQGSTPNGSGGQCK